MKTFVMNDVRPEELQSVLDDLRFEGYAPIPTKQDNGLFRIEAKDKTENTTDSAIDDRLTLARTIYGEARGEPTEGKEAVGHVVMNRVARSTPPRSIAEICLQPKQFACWNPSDPNYEKIRKLTPGKDPDFDLCFEIAEQIIKGSVTDRTAGATHYTSTSLPPPNWLKPPAQPTLTVKIGTRQFFTNVTNAS